MIDLLFDNSSFLSLCSFPQSCNLPALSLISYRVYTSGHVLQTQRDAPRQLKENFYQNESQVSLQIQVMGGGGGEGTLQALTMGHRDPDPQGSEAGLRGRRSAGADERRHSEASVTQCGAAVLTGEKCFGNKLSTNLKMGNRKACSSSRLLYRNVAARDGSVRV